MEDEVVYNVINDGTKKEEFKMEKNSCYGSHKSASSSHVRPAKSSTAIKAIIFLVVITGLLLLALLVSSAIAWHEISKSQLFTANVESSVDTLNKSVELMSHEIANSIDMLNESIYQYKYSLERSINESMQIIHQIASLESSIDMLNGSIKLLNQHFHTIIENITEIKVMSSPPVFPANSCADVLLLAPSAPSNYYWIRSSNGSAVRVYCDMTISCGGVTGGWMRVAKLDMRDNSSQCPNSLQQHIDSNNIRTCLVAHTTATHCTCSASTTFPTDALSYSRVCGRIKGYQFGTPDAFYYANPNCDRNIFYVDGISFTRGNPRQHIWTFAAGVSENENHLGRCPCFMDGPPPPSFVGNDYFCDTGNKESLDFNRYLYEDPLWDGINCSNSTCCSFNNPPWFYKQLPEHTTDNIEMRICRDQLATDENIAIELVELYIN